MPIDFERRHTVHQLATAKLERAVATGSDPAHQLITGYGAVFYNSQDPGTQYELWPGFFERIDRHAFDIAIRDDDVRALFNHNPDNLLGRSKAGTLKLRADDKGLFYEIDPPSTQLAKQVSVAIERGDLSGSSFAFTIDVEEISHEGELVIRTIKRATLYDVGPVTYPAYEASTTGLSTRSALLREKEIATKAHGTPLSIRKRQLDLLSRDLRS